MHTHVVRTYVLHIIIIQTAPIFSPSVIIDWGDGEHTSKILNKLGPYQSKPLHRYRVGRKSYTVTVTYCHTPPWLVPRDGSCCDKISQTIYLTE